MMDIILGALKKMAILLVVLAVVDLILNCSGTFFYYFMLCSRKKDTHIISLIKLGKLFLCDEQRENVHEKFI